MERLPHGRLIAIDRSWNMLMTARANLRPVFGIACLVRAGVAARSAVRRLGRSRVQHGDVSLGQGSSGALRRHLHALRSGGRLHAQCGGGPNLARAHELAEQVMHAAAVRARTFGDWPGPWEFANAEVTAERLRRPASSTSRRTSKRRRPRSPTEADYREFVTTVIYHPHLERLPDAGAESGFIDRVTELAVERSVRSRSITGA